MGNSMGKKRKMANGLSKKHKLDSHVVPYTSSSLQNIVVEFPKEIEEDLERRKIESLKALNQKKKPPARTISAPALSASDPAHEFYEKARGLDVPAVMVPKPWSEVDQILSKLKTPDSKNAPPSPMAKTPLHRHAETLPETIDMSELMDDLDDEDENEDRTPNMKVFEEVLKPSTESVTPEEVTPEKIRSLESSLSFSTIHTVKEVEGGNAKPETVTSILKSGSPARRKSSSAAVAPTSPSPRKVNVNPRLLARMEAFM